MDQLKLGKFISTLRKEKGITQQELAQYLGVSDKAVSKWERGINCPDISLLTLISDYFDITTNELLLGEKIKGSISKEKQDKVSKEIIEYSKIEINYNKKLQKKLKRFLIIVIIILVFIISIFIYKDYQLKKEQRNLKEYTVYLEENLKTLNFKKDSPLRSNNWILNYDNVTYVIPNITYKDESKTNIYKEILSYDNYENLEGIIIYYNTTKISVYYYEKSETKSKKININCDKNGNLVKGEKYSGKQKQFYNENEAIIKKRIKDIRIMWENIYN